MNPTNLRTLLIFLCLTCAPLTASAGVIGSSVFDSEQCSVSSVNSETPNSIPSVQANHSTSGMSTSCDTIRVDLPLGPGCLVALTSEDESRQRAYTSPEGYVPKPIPDPLLKIPICK